MQLSMKARKTNLSTRRIGLCWEATRAPRWTRKPQAWAISVAQAGLLRVRSQCEKSTFKLTSTKTRIVSYASTPKETFTLNQYIFNKRQTLALGLVAWMSTNFVVYRLGLWWMDWHRPCSCLGNLTDALHISPQLADNIMKWLLFFLLIGSYGLLARRWTWWRSRTGELQA